MAHKTVSETERRLHDLTMVGMFISLGVLFVAGGITFRRAPSWWLFVLLGIGLLASLPLGVPKRAVNWMRRSRPGSHAFWIVTSPIIMVVGMSLYTYMTGFDFFRGKPMDWWEYILSGSLALGAVWNAALLVYNFVSLVRARRAA